MATISLVNNKKSLTFQAAMKVSSDKFSSAVASVDENGEAQDPLSEFWSLWAQYEEKVIVEAFDMSRNFAKEDAVTIISGEGLP